jgi:RNA polymerase sigma factor (sigma-70 family)
VEKENRNTGYPAAAISLRTESDMTDDQLIAKIRSGGQSDLGWIYEKYRGEFLHWISREFNCSTDDSKDIYQLTILIFYDNVRSGKLEHLVSSIKTYLYGIGKNVARDNMRKVRRNTPINQQPWLMEYLVDEADDKPDENLFVVAKKVLTNLGQPCQRLVELYYYEKKSMEEISVELNYKNADTAKNQKCKCMARLRALFEKELSTTTINTFS